MVIMVIKQTKVSTDLCIENLSVVLRMVVSVYGYQRLYMVTSVFLVIVVISGYQWFSVVTRACTWSPVVFMVIMVISGYQWFSVVTRDCVWSPVVFMVIMVISGYQWFLWLPETVHGYHWFLWLSWLSVVISGFLWLPLLQHAPLEQFEGSKEATSTPRRPAVLMAGRDQDH